MGYELKQEDIFGLASAVGAETRQKGDELFFRHCPYCGGGESKDRDTFSVNLDSGAFSCFRSGCSKKGHFVELARDFHYTLDFNDGKSKSYRSFPQRPVEVRDSAVRYLASRGISCGVTERYKITSRKDNPEILAFPFYDTDGVMSYVKYRNTKHKKGQGSKEWAEKDGCPILFGMAQCGGFDRLVITEGQIDSLSLAEAGIPNAVSVPNGMNGFTWLDNCWEWMTRFHEVIVFGDCEHGKITLLDTLQKRLPVCIKAVRVEDYLGEKDANDILQKYGAHALIAAVENAREVPLPFVKELADVEPVDLNGLECVRTSIREIDRVIGGLYFGQIALLTGKRGDGKSTFMSQLIAEALDQGYPVLAYSGELADYHFKRWLNFQLAGPNKVKVCINQFGDEVYSLDSGTDRQISEWYRGRAYLYDNNAIPDDSGEMEGLLATVEHAIRRYGIRAIFIDNLMTALDVGMSEDLYRAQSAFVRRLKLLANRYNVAVLLIAHPRKTKDGSFANDDVAGSGDITNRVDVVLNYARAPENSDDCDGMLLVTKNRLTGKLALKGKEIRLFYSQSTKRITSETSGNRVYGWERTKEIRFDDSLDLPF